MKTFLIVFLSFFAFKLAAQKDTIQMAEETVPLPVSYVKKNERVILHVVFDAPQRVLLNGDCEYVPRMYTLVEKTPAGWKPYPHKTTTILMCGPGEFPHVSSFDYSIHFTKTGTFVIVIPVGDKKYYTGEVVVE